MEISGLPRGFSTCCLRFTNGVATIHAKLASGWRLAFTGRELNPLDRYKRFLITFIPLFWIYPGARRALLVWGN